VHASHQPAFPEELLLEDNNLEGEIPSAIYEMTNLEKLSLVSNSLTGTISTKIGNLKNLSKSVPIGRQVHTKLGLTSFVVVSMLRTTSPT
jgi:hypothetical protein